MPKKSTVLFCIIIGTYIIYTIINGTVMKKITLNYLFRIWSYDAPSWSTSPDNYVDDWKCSENYTLMQAKSFQELFSKDRTWSACYTNDYLSKLYLADFNVTERQNKIFFDIGANKGYTIAAWLSTWKPHIGLNQKNLYDYLFQTFKINDCGTCLDCKEASLTDLPKNNHFDTRIEIYAFEPVKSTYEALLQVRIQFNVSTLHLHQLAMSNTTGTANVSNCRIGGERCGLMSVRLPVPKETVFEVKTMTLDDFVEQKQLKQKIDLLKIDAEGADPLVLDGAKKLLSQEQVRMLIFENHEIGAWKTTSLLDVIESLKNNNYICHMIGKTGLARLTDCWSPLYDVKRRSNILCVHRQEKRLRYFLDQLLIIDT